MSDLQLFDALPAHIEDALRASIRRFGVLSPVTRDQHGRILDGHHRVRIAAEEGIGIADDVIIHVKDDDEAREIARTLNADRRQLTEEQRRAVVADLRRDGHSVRAIAGALRVGKSTIDRDVSQLSRTGQLEQPEHVKTLDGKTYPARRPQPTTPPAPDPVPPSDADLLAGAEWSAAPPTPLPADQERAKEAVRTVDEAIARHVPADPEEENREWRRNFLAALSAARRPLQFRAADVAERADAECLDELSRFVADLSKYHDDVKAAGRDAGVIQMGVRR